MEDWSEAFAVGLCRRVDVGLEVAVGFFFEAAFGDSPPEVIEDLLVAGLEASVGFDLAELRLDRCWGPAEVLAGFADVVGERFAAFFLAFLADFLLTGFEGCDFERRTEGRDAVLGEDAVDFSAGNRAGATVRVDRFTDFFADFFGRFFIHRRALRNARDRSRTGDLQLMRLPSCHCSTRGCC